MQEGVQKWMDNTFPIENHPSLCWWEVSEDTLRDGVVILDEEDQEGAVG